MKVYYMVAVAVLVLMLGAMFVLDNTPSSPSQPQQQLHQRNRFG